MKLLINEEQYHKIQKYLLEAVNADELESHVGTLPNVQVKGGRNGELDNNGDIDYEFAQEFEKFMSDMSKCCSKCRFTITAGNDKYHAKDTKSLHPKGLAIDFTSQPYKPGLGCVGKVIKGYPNFHFIDEYRNPSARSTGGHFHIGYKKKGVMVRKPSEKDGETEQPEDRRISSLDQIPLSMLGLH